MNRLTLFATTLLLAAGCGGGDSGPEMADVSGTITLAGKPLTDADVHFVADGFAGYGRTNNEGRYSLVRGAPVGTCKVYIVKQPEMEGGGGIDLSIDGMDEGQLQAMAASQGGQGVKPLLPAEFSDPNQTRLTIDVPPDGTDSADFKL